MSQPSDPLDRAGWFLAGYDDAAEGGERMELARVRHLLANDAMWAQPPPELADAIIHQIAPHALPARRARWPRRALLGGLSLAAAVLVVVGVVAMLRDPSGDGSGVETVALAATDLAPGASAHAELVDTASGVAVTLYTTGLAPAPPGFYYQAWVTGPDGGVALGTFHVREGQGDDHPIELWSGVDLAGYPKITVTLEAEDGNAASSGKLILTGDLPG